LTCDYIVTFEIYIKTTPERLWDAITDGDIRSKYTFGNQVISDWTPGSPVEMRSSDGNFALGCYVRGREPRGRFAPAARPEHGGPLEPVGDSCRLTVTHDELREGANGELYGGWPMILSGLKTYLETGELLTTPGSLMYANPGPSDGKR
jgi:hypothetical protein